MKEAALYRESYVSFRPLEDTQDLSKVVWRYAAQSVDGRQLGVTRGVEQ